MNRIKAFTIIELMVVMLISTMVMAIAYQGYLLFYKQFIVFRNTSKEVADVSLFDRLMSADMSDCKYVIKRDKGIDCVYEGKTIQYVWEDEFILRKRVDMVDTFYHKTESLVFNFLTKSAVDQQLVDEVIFVDLKNNKQRGFHYIKEYGADVLLNNIE